jgi:HEAT repeat protein
MPSGFQVLSEVVISDGKLKIVKSVADTLEAAFAKAQSEIPINAEILIKKEASPERKVIIIEVHDAQTARVNAQEEARARFGKTGIVKDFTLLHLGKKGFLGIGSKPNRYKAVLIAGVVAVEVIYRTRVRVIFRLGNPHMQTFDEIQQFLDEGKKYDAFRFIYFLYEKLEDGNTDERKEAARLLCYVPPIGDTDSITRLMIALEKEDHLDVIKNIIWGLRGLEAKTAIPKLRKMLDDNKYATIKENIERAIKYLSGD